MVAIVPNRPWAVWDLSQPEFFPSCSSSLAIRALEAKFCPHSYICAILFKVPLMGSGGTNVSGQTEKSGGAQVSLQV